MASNQHLDGYRLSECEPLEWFVVFSENSPRWWVRWLSWGRFKHVSVFGKVDRAGCWVFHDVWMNRAQILLVGDWEADVTIAHFTDGATIVRFPRLLADDHDIALRIGQWCVPAVAQILGIRSCALRPDALYRQILAKGGRIIGSEGQGDEAESRERSGTGTPESGGQDRESSSDPEPSVE